MHTRARIVCPGASRKALSVVDAVAGDVGGDPRGREYCVHITGLFCWVRGQKNVSSRL